MKLQFLLTTGLINFLIFFNCTAQLQLNPVMGLAVTKNYMTNSNNQLVSLNGKDVFWGLEVDKKINLRFNVIFPIHITNISLKVADANTFEFKFPANYEFLNSIVGPKHYMLEGVGTTYNSFGIIGEYNLINAGFLEIKPSMGITINRVTKTCFDCSTITFPLDSTYYKNLETEEDFYNGFSYTKPGSGDKIVKNRHSLSLNFGLKFQLKDKTNRESLFLKFMVSQGLMVVMESPYTKIINDFSDPNENHKYKIGSGNFQTKGSYFSIYIGYPITILNKKGERYRDRHQKN